MRHLRDPRLRPERQREEPRAPEPAPPVAELLRLQQGAGNRFVGALLRQVAPPAPPKTDAQIWEDDWNDPAFASDTAYFEGSDRPTGDKRHRYDVLCPLYKARGIDRPLKYIHDNIIWSDFFGHRTPMHKDLKTKLKAAEKKLNDDGVTTAPFRKCWAFNARTQTNGTWSNHADGKAIDIDEGTNPRLLNAGERTVITALTGMDIAAANPGAAQGLDSYDASKEASRLFQDRYSAGGIAARVEELAGEGLDLDQEKELLADELKGVKTGKGATADDVKKAKELKGKIAAKQAEVAAKAAARKALETEYTRFQAFEKAIEDLQKAIAQLEQEIDALTAELEKLDRDEPLKAGDVAVTGKEKDKQIKARKAAIVTKSAAIKAKQKSLTKAIENRDTDPLHGYAAHGFLDLDKPLVVALKGTGLRWGGDYSGAKDFMHFEVV